MTIKTAAAPPLPDELLTALHQDAPALPAGRRPGGPRDRESPALGFRRRSCGC